MLSLQDGDRKPLAISRREFIQAGAALMGVAAVGVSGCKKRGDDTLYPGIIEIDEDVREEYWVKIRNQPDKVHLTSVRSEGKYSKRRPK